MPALPVPDFSIPDPTSDNARAQAWSMLTAKYADAGSWAVWGATTLEQRLTDLRNLLGTDIVGDNLTAVMAAVDAIVQYTPTGTFTYTAPDAPTYADIPMYVAPTLGTIEDIPAVDAITIGDAPDTTVSFSNSAFSDSLLDDLKTRLASDLGTSHTGLGNAETALFARETARQNAVRAAAYTEITTQFSARGFDLPPGALTAKQTEMNNESTIRLSDSSSQIMAESARLAVDYNKTVLSATTQLLDLVSRVFDNKIMRDFEAAKTAVQYAIEGFKQEVSVALAKADLNKTAITATIAKNDGTVKVFQSEIEGQVGPIKALADVNQAMAGAYGAAVQAETANLNAQVIPEELKLKGVEANAQITGTKAELVMKEANVAIEVAARQLQLEAATIAGLAQSAAQLVAGAMNGVSASASFGFSGSASTTYKGD